MLATVLLLIAMQAPSQRPEVQAIRSQIEQTRSQIVVLEQKHHNLQKRKDKHQELARQIEQTQMQIDKSKQDLAYLESLLSQELALPRLNSNDLENELERLRDQLKGLWIPPEHPPSPRLKKSA